MIRFLLFLFLVYIIWKIIQVVSRVMSGSRSDHENVFGSQPTPKKTQTFKDVQDAEFEELPPDDKKKSS